MPLTAHSDVKYLFRVALRGLLLALERLNVIWWTKNIPTAPKPVFGNLILFSCPETWSKLTACTGSTIYRWPWELFSSHHLTSFSLGKCPLCSGSGWSLPAADPFSLCPEQTLAADLEPLNRNVAATMARSVKITAATAKVRSIAAELGYFYSVSTAAVQHGISQPFLQKSDWPNISVDERWLGNVRDRPTVRAERHILRPRPPLNAGWTKSSLAVTRRGSTSGGQAVKYFTARREPLQRLRVSAVIPTEPNLRDYRICESREETRPQTAVKMF